MSEGKTDNCANNYIGIDDPDRPIYRIYPLWYFQSALRLKQLVLVQPQLWSDPYELLPWRCKYVERKPRYREAMSEPYMRPVYAQCWSATKESDTLISAYSRVVRHKHESRNECPGEEGVTVSSTPRKLLESLQEWATPDRKFCCFVGRVKYSDSVGIHERLGKVFGGQMPQDKISARQMAELMLLKRDAFEHENEVRLIYVETRKIPPSDRVTCQIAPNEVFDSVKFDPRLAIFERNERERSATGLGYTGKFETSSLYTAPLLTIILN